MLRHSAAAASCSSLSCCRSAGVSSTRSLRLALLKYTVRRGSSGLYACLPMCARISSGRIGIAGKTSVASCEGSSSKQRCAAFSSAGSVKVLARCHTLSALDGARRAPIALAHASLSASTTRRAAASSTSVSRPSSISHLPS
eukprot:scaffold49135_cov76-Phaeocystis_antarctica.AAC.5